MKLWKTTNAAIGLPLDDGSGETAGLESDEIGCVVRRVRFLTLLPIVNSFIPSKITADCVCYWN